MATKPRLTDTLRVVSAAMAALFATLFKRLMGRKKRDSWPLRLEAIVAAQQGTWTAMPKIGMLRWRAVGHALSPLLSDGLPVEKLAPTEGFENVEAFWLKAPEAKKRILLYFHGGGFVFGGLITHGDMIGALTRASNSTTLALEYPLAPEHRAPAAIESAVAAYRLLLKRGNKPESIVFAGDSAGGNLVLTTLLALRDAGDPLPAAGVAISPWVDLTNSGDSFQKNAPTDFVGKEHCDEAAAHYLGELDGKSPQLSPLYADLSGLPPLLVQAGGAETLVDQIRAFVAKAEEAGLKVDYSEYPDMVHVWHMLRGHTPEAERGITEVGKYIQRHSQEN